MRISSSVRRRTFLLALLAVSCIYLFTGRGGAAGDVVLTFRGGAREVGGSCQSVDTGKSLFLVDCGAMGSAGTGVVPAEASEYSFVILTHAHTDHCGLLPELFEAGFAGKVYCTPETALIVPVMLKMARSFSRDRVPAASFEAALAGLTPVEFGKKVWCGEVGFVFREAGHLLGAAFVEIDIEGEKGDTRIVFSGDLGSGSSLLLPRLGRCERADYVVIESTYGGRRRELDTEDGACHLEFMAEVGKALRRGGDVLIPAFTLGRTQEVIAALHAGIASGLIPADALIYSDSPTANRISRIYRDSIDRDISEALSAMAGEDGYGAVDAPGTGMTRGSSPGKRGRHLLSPSNLREVRSRTSMKVHSRDHVPSVFISSSGDLQHANSPRHLFRMASMEDNLLCIVGWQQPGSVGWRLERGEDPVLLRHREGNRTEKHWISPAIEVRRFRSFSSHADQDSLLGWLSGISGLREVFVVHGESDQAGALSDRVSSELGVEVRVPAPMEQCRLKAGDASRHGASPAASGKGR